MCNQGCDGKDDEEQCGERDRGVELVASVKLEIPTNVEQQRADIAQHQQAAPGLARHHDHRGQVEQGKIGEQLEFVVLPGGKQQGSRKTASKGKRRKDLGILGDCERSCGGGHGKHGHEGHTTRNQGINMEGRPE